MCTNTLQHTLGDELQNIENCASAVPTHHIACLLFICQGYSVNGVCPDRCLSARRRKTQWLPSWWGQEPRWAFQTGHLSCLENNKVNLKLWTALQAITWMWFFFSRGRAEIAGAFKLCSKFQISRILLLAVPTHPQQEIWQNMLYT